MLIESLPTKMHELIFKLLGSFIASALLWPLTGLAIMFFFGYRPTVELNLLGSGGTPMELGYLVPSILLLVVGINNGLVLGFTFWILGVSSKLGAAIISAGIIVTIVILIFLAAAADDETIGRSYSLLDLLIAAVKYSIFLGLHAAAIGAVALVITDRIRTANRE